MKSADHFKSITEYFKYLDNLADKEQWDRYLSTGKLTDINIIKKDLSVNYMIAQLWVKENHPEVATLLPTIDTSPNILTNTKKKFSELLAKIK